MARTCSVSRDTHCRERSGRCRSCSCCVSSCQLVAGPVYLSRWSLMPLSSSRWKSPIFIHKNSLPPTLSFVIAEPQQTRSRVSAADSLPNILRRAMPLDSELSPSNPTPSHEESTADNSPELPPLTVVDSDVSNQSVPGAIIPRFRHDAQLIIWAKGTKVLHQPLRQPLPQTTFP